MLPPWRLGKRLANKLGSLRRPTSEGPAASRRSRSPSSHRPSAYPSLTRLISAKAGAARIHDTGRRLRGWLAFAADGLKCQEKTANQLDLTQATERENVRTYFSLTVWLYWPGGSLRKPSGEARPKSFDSSSAAPLCGPCLLPACLSSFEGTPPKWAFIV